MTWLQITLWVGAVWFAFLIGFVLGAAWNGIFREQRAAEKRASAIVPPDGVMADR
jgi:hypothetical protein